MLKKLFKNIVGPLAAVLLLAGSNVRADDTEIYYHHNYDTSHPIVMFYIEYTSSLVNPQCGGGVATWATFATACPDYADLLLYMSNPNDTALNNPMAHDDLADGTLDQFEMTRAALKRVLISLGSMKIGLATSHNSDTGCAGPSATNCSNGAEIYAHAVSLTKVSDIVTTHTFDPLNDADRRAVLAADTNKAWLFSKLDNIQTPHGNFSADNQNKENYFELYRYFTGGRIYNGHNGWNDFSSNKTDIGTPYNLGDYYDGQNNGGFDCASGTGTCYQDTAGIHGLYQQATKQGNSYKGAFKGDFFSFDVNLTPPFMSTSTFKWDTAAETTDHTSYISPIDENCQKLFIINMVDGRGNHANGSDAAINADFNKTIQLNDSGFSDIAKWMFQMDLDATHDGTQNVTSYFVANHTDQVSDAASAGSGGANAPYYLSNNPKALVDTINKVFDQIVSVSTTFTAAAIPVNVFNRSEVIDNAYIALFQANAAGLPQWVGNLKKLKLDIYQVQVPVGTDPTTGATIYKTENRLQLIDTNPDHIDTDPSTAVIDPPSAIASDGRIISSALTFWTNGLGYDLYDNIGADETSGRDGRAVNRGGAGQLTPLFLSSALNTTTNHYENSGNIGLTNSTANSRQLFTNYNGAFVPLDYTKIQQLWPDLVIPTDSGWSTATDLSLLNGIYANDYLKTYSSGCHWNTATVAPCTMYMEAYSLLAFIRGADGNDSNNNNNNLEPRRWVMGDPLHSRPMPINYGARPGYSSSNPDIRVVMGSNDGFLRMVRNTNTDGTESGKESWAFMPRELLHMQKRLMDDLPSAHLYGLDGAPTVYIVDDNGTISPTDCSLVNGVNRCDEALVFFGLRRGGFSYYGLNVTNPDTPSYMWRIDRSSTGFGEMGNTFSSPTVRELDWGSGRGAAIIVGGGYDTNKDNAGIGTNDTMGNAIYIIDAHTGALIWKATGNAAATTGLASNTYSLVPNMVDSIPSEVTAYDSTGDGLVDRIYVGDTGGRVWRVDMPSNDRSQWSVRMILDVGRHYNSTLADDRRFFYPPDVVPSRDRSGLFDGVVIGSGNREHPLDTSTSDFLYTYKDRPTSTGTLTQADLVDITHLNDCLIAGTCSPDLTSGWRLQLTEPGEKSLSSPLTLRGDIYFNSYIPKTTSCGPDEGSGRLYRVALSNGTAVYNYYTPNDTSDVVLGERDRFRTLASGGIPAENVYVSFKQGNETFTGILAPDLNAGEDLGAQQWNTYWFEKQK